MIFQVLVTEKKEDRVFVTLERLLSFCYDGDNLPEDKYDSKDFKEEILKVPKVFEQLSHIHSFQIKGQIKKYDVDEVNIMAYFVNFNRIKKGDLLHAIVKRKEDNIVSMSMKNQLISGCRQRKFEKYDSVHRDLSYFARLGYSDLARIDRNVLEIDPFFEENLGFQNNNLFDITSSNYAEINDQLNGLNLKNSHVTLNPCTNIRVYDEIDLDFNRIRELQNTVWANESLNQGIELAQHKLYKEAIEFYDNAILMDDKTWEAYVAKGCALANMEKYAEGLKQIEIVLKEDPENENAKKYHESISEKLKEAEREIFKIDDRNKVLLVKTKKHSEKESYNDLILSDDDERERKSKKSKKSKRDK